MECAASTPVLIERDLAHPVRLCALSEPRSGEPVGLAGSPLAERFRHWQGHSGRRYLFSVFPISDRESVALCPRYENSVVLVVACGPGGSRHIVHVAQTGALPDMVFDGLAFRTAVAAGADEVHVHLLATSLAARGALMADLLA